MPDRCVLCVLCCQASLELDAARHGRLACLQLLAARGWLAGGRFSLAELLQAGRGGVCMCSV